MGRSALGTRVEDPATPEHEWGADGPGPKAQVRFQCLEVAPGAFRWRLIAGNGRCLGRSSTELPDVRAVLDGIAHLHRAARHAQVVHTHVENGVGWQVVIGTHVLAECAHTYGRAVEASRAADRFLAECLQAMVDPTVAAVRCRAPQGRYRH